MLMYLGCFDLIETEKRILQQSWTSVAGNDHFQSHLFLEALAFFQHLLLLSSQVHPLFFLKVATFSIQTTTNISIKT